MRNRLLFIWLALLLGVAGANAKEAYAFYMESDHSLNFCYDDSKASIAQSYTIYDLNTGSNTPAWSNIASQIEELYFYTSFANYRPTSCYAWARDMTNLTRVRNISNLNTWSVTNMSCMFYRCSNLTSLDLSNFKTQNVTDMEYMFSNCSSLTSLNLSNFNTSSVTNMRYMFADCSSLTSLNLSNFNTQNVTDMNSMFYHCSSLTSLNLSNFNTQNVTDMSSMFSGCKKLTTLNISSFNTSKVTTFMGMFEFCSSLESLDVSKFDTSNATYELLMLGGFTGMFRGCSSLTTLDLSNFDTSKAKSMYVMFQGCSNLESVNLSSFNTSNVAYFDGMFSGCSKLTELDLSNFDFSKTSVLLDSIKMLNDCSALKLLLIPSTANNLPADACYGVGTKTSPCTLVYPSGFTPDKQSSGSDWYQWKSGYFKDVEPEEYAFLSTDGKTLTFYYDKNRYTRTGGTAYALNGETPGWHSYASSVTKVVFNSSFANARPGSCYMWFDGMTNLTSITGMASYLNTSDVGDMGYMFNGCSKLTTLDLSNFNTSDAYDLRYMFSGCSSLTTLDLRSFKTFNVMYMNCMFKDCTKLTSIDVSSFDTDGIEAYGETGDPMYEMFSGCSSLTSLDISNFYFSECFSYGDYANYIGYNLLNKCSALKTLSIPATANNLDAGACAGVGAKTSPCTLVYPSGFTPEIGSSGSGWYNWKGGYFCDPAVGIPFADNTVKGICLDNWDTNGDGQLTKAEAAAVTSVGTVFKAASITTFDEFKYFTGVETISEGAFSKSTLTAITLPSSVKTIGKDAFLACKSLKSITIPAKVTTIGQNALSYCTAMTSITVASDNTAFASVSGVLFTKSRKTLLQFPAAKATTYSVPSRTTTIGRDAFFMSSLKSVELPSSLMELAYDAFGYCKSLTSVELPEGLTTIGDYAFDGCSGLKTLRLPSTVTSIGSYMCNNCKAITDIYNASTTPFSIADNNFTSTTYSNATLHVPAGRKATYAALGGWKEFTKVVDDLPGGILGDSNGDGTVSVNDVQMIVEYVLGNNPSGIRLANCDVNGDNVITITDATTIVNIVLTGVQAMPPKARESLTDMVALTAKGSHCSLHLDSSEPYHAFQLEVVLPEGGSMGNVMLAQGRANGHHAEWNEVMPGRYNVIVYSFNGAALRDGSSTALLHFDIANCKADDVSVEGIQMVDGWCKTVLLPSTSGIATGIAWVVDDASESSNSPYYNTVGIGSNTPQRGVNIKDGRKVVKK